LGHGLTCECHTIKTLLNRQENKQSFGLNAVVHPFGVVHDFKLGGVSESSEMSEWARVVAKENEKGNGQNDRCKLEQKGGALNCAWT
jgi:hypothetical protein